MKILMVCLGNICRSPLAEGILKHYIKREKLDWFVDSAGTGAWHIGRKIRSSDFEEFDVIFAMDSSNYNDLQRYALDDEEKEKIKFILNETKPNQNNSVPDPYWDDNGFEKVYQMLDIACKSFIEKHR